MATSQHKIQVLFEAETRGFSEGLSRAERETAKLQDRFAAAGKRVEALGRKLENSGTAATKAASGIGLMAVRIGALATVAALAARRVAAWADATIEAANAQSQISVSLNQINPATVELAGSVQRVTTSLVGWKDALIDSIASAGIFQGEINAINRTMQGLETGINFVKTKLNELGDTMGQMEVKFVDLNGNVVTTGQSFEDLTKKANLNAVAIEGLGRPFSDLSPQMREAAAAQEALNEALKDAEIRARNAAGIWDLQERIRRGQAKALREEEAAAKALAIEQEALDRAYQEQIESVALLSRGMDAMTQETIDAARAQELLANAAKATNEELLRQAVIAARDAGQTSGRVRVPGVHGSRLVSKPGLTGGLFSKQTEVGVTADGSVVTN